MAEGGELPKPTGEQSPKPEGTKLKGAMSFDESELDYNRSKSPKPEGPTAGTGLKFTSERFNISPKDTTSSASNTEAERLKQVANTPAADLLKSSQWRRDALASASPANKKGVVSFDESGDDPIRGNKQDQPALNPNQGKPNK